MKPAPSRKRSHIATESDDDETQQYGYASPAPSSLSDTSKRSRAQCELDELDIISVKDAWSVDIDAILSSKHIATPLGSRLEAHDNWDRYERGESIVVLCVQGNVHVHYDLLCKALPDLYAVSPSLQAFVLCHDPSTHILSPNAPFALPMIQAYDPPNNHIVRLGLLHPLGGGKLPLDALVVLDRDGKRRLVLPFGWGPGKLVDTAAGRGIQIWFTQLLRRCVETLERE